MPPVTNTRPTTEIIEVLEWCRDQGAVHIKVGDVEVAFPLPVAAFAPQMVQAPAEQPGALPPPRHPLDDPDMYASEFDRWSRHKPVGRI